MRNGHTSIAAKKQVAGRSRVTISDVADDLGVTKSTVSRALNGYPDIAEATRLRISRAAERLGYRPLAHAQAIRTGRVRSLGLVLQIDADDGARPFLANFIAGVTQAASEENWTITIATAESEKGVRETLSRLVDEHKADGFILPRTLLRDRRVETLRAQNIPFIMFGRTEDPTDCAWYDIKGEDAMRAATARLISLGHTRIAHVPGGQEYTYSKLRIEGYRAGLDAAGLVFDPDLVGAPALTGRDGDASVRALLSLPEPPTAFTFAVDRAALGAYRTARDLGLRIGEDISIIAYDGLPEGAYADPGLTTFAVNSRQAGERLARLLIKRIRGTAPEDLRELAPATLVERGSDRPPRLSSADLALRLKTNSLI
ncbi:LacI family DNA-binding transcriptional regulator [Shimia sp. Alg240-R146]|uniref:LacI family DNA-binding transcriptional regulator n=1 Tax=Shimia sp. Alg240-R146 TaxID=2993449 RepID=UPI0022E62BF8|nr:substrate-binding domain-containing protein [Shimia sp. Alg240-R146]